MLKDKGLKPHTTNLNLINIIFLQQTEQTLPELHVETLQNPVSLCKMKDRNKASTSINESEIRKRKHRTRFSRRLIMDLEPAYHSTNIRTGAENWFLQNNIKVKYPYQIRKTQGLLMIVIVMFIVRK